MRKVVKFSTVWLKRQMFLSLTYAKAPSQASIDYDSLRPVNPQIIHANVSDMARGFDEGSRRFRSSWPGPLRIDVCERWPEPSCYTRVMDQARHRGKSCHSDCLFVRERSGMGQEVMSPFTARALADVSQYHVIQCVIAWSDGYIPTLRPLPLRTSSVARTKVDCGDAPSEEKYWPLFCKATGQTDLLTTLVYG